jgi:hypothetical protein
VPETASDRPPLRAPDGAPARRRFRRHPWHAARPGRAVAPASAACGASEPGHPAGPPWGKVASMAGAVGLSAPEGTQGTKGPRGALRGAGVLRRVVVEGPYGQRVLGGRGRPRPDKAGPAPSRGTCRPASSVGRGTPRGRPTRRPRLLRLGRTRLALRIESVRAVVGASDVLKPVWGEGARYLPSILTLAGENPKLRNKAKP